MDKQPKRNKLLSKSCKKQKMIVRNVSEGVISNDDLAAYTAKLEKFNGTVANAPMFKIDKRIVSFKVADNTNGEPATWFTLVNPIITQYGGERIAYPEFIDYNKYEISRKSKRVVRHTEITVNTDNYGALEFKADGGDLDIGLLKCVLVQRLVDSINGIDITSKDRAYNIQRKAPKKIGRNEKICVMSESGDMLFIKSKLFSRYAELGYKIV